MIGLLLIAAAGATAVLVALGIRLQSLVSTLLVAYLAFVAELGLVTLALSPIRQVTRPGLAVAEVGLLAAATYAWHRRGRPGLPAVDLPFVARALAASPVTLAFLAFLGLALGYELVQALTVPANNWDSLTYHLPRAASWAQHHGIYHIDDPATERMNDYQPLAEQQLLFLFVASGSDAFFALPQMLAELAILVAVYGAARRLGYEIHASVCAACLLATFSLVALQAPTAQNDLVAASFPAVAACLILGGANAELVLAGVAVGLGIGAKLTTTLVLPVLLVLGVLRGRRALVLGAAGTLAGLVAVSMWGFVLNLVHTGRLLGTLGTHVDSSSVPIRPGKLSTALDVLYETFDPALLSDRRIHVLAIAGAAVGLAVAAYALLRRTGVLGAIARGGRVAVPFLAPILIVGAAGVVAWLARKYGSPIRGPGGNVGPLNHTTAGSTFGPVGALVFLGVPIVTLAAWALRRVDARHAALAAAVPLYYVLLSTQTFNYFLNRFLLVPAVLAAPLFARLFRDPAETAAYAVVAALVLVPVMADNTDRPLDGRFGHFWNLTPATAAALTDEPGVGEAVAAYEQRVPKRACVGALVGSDEPSYLLWGRDLDRRVVYLATEDPLTGAYRNGVFYVVISPKEHSAAADTFRSGGWQVEPLSSYWLLAVAPRPGREGCGD